MRTTLGKIFVPVLILAFVAGLYAFNEPQTNVLFTFVLLSCDEEPSPIDFSLQKDEEVVLKTNRYHKLEITQATFEELEGSALVLFLDDSIDESDYQLNPYFSCKNEEPKMDYDEIFLEDLKAIENTDHVVKLYLKDLWGQLNPEDN
ncbi:MAG: hypothetical protein AAFQ83_11930 [Bacteroidota bacterium]